MSPSVSRGVPGATHVLALCDPFPASLDAAWRAALVACDLRLPMRLLHPASASGAPPAAIASFAREAAERCQLHVELVPARDDAVAQAVQLARGGLVVLSTADGNPLGGWLMGSPAERLIRLVRAPVLVVKQAARAAYRRVLVAVDLRPASERLVALGASLSRGAGLAVFHAITPGEELVLREMDAPAEALRAHRRMRANWASTCMELLHPASAATPVVAFGTAAQGILAGETGHRADLIVIGKRRRGLLADFLLGSVTRQVLAKSEADVLVVPLASREQRSTPARSAGASLQG